MDELSTVIQWMSLLGIPSIFAMTGWCIKTCIGYTKKLTILMKAQQAQMRAQLLKEYNYYMDRGWVGDDDLTEWINQYESYHQLGANGVLDERKRQLIVLPNKPQEV